jgi:hypothetical protein
MHSHFRLSQKCAATCAEHRDSQEKEATGVVKMCNRMCYQRCDCLPDFYLLDVGTAGERGGGGGGGRGQVKNGFGGTI